MKALSPTCWLSEDLRRTAVTTKYTFWHPLYCTTARLLNAIARPLTKSNQLFQPHCPWLLFMLPDVDSLLIQTHPPSPCLMASPGFSSLLSWALDPMIPLTMFLDTLNYQTHPHFGSSLLLSLYAHVAEYSWTKSLHPHRLGPQHTHDLPPHGSRGII